MSDLRKLRAILHFFEEFNCVITTAYEILIQLMMMNMYCGTSTREAVIIVTKLT